jgi:hypothetical protein
LPHTANDLLAACDEYEGSWILWLCNEQASWGTFEELEGYLRRVRIPFDRHTDSTAIYDGEWFAYRPGWGTATMTINQEGHAVVPIDGLRHVQRLLDGACQASANGKDPSRSLRRACRRMQRELPRPFPQLPSFTIGGASSRK